jgi:hypothetical protein
MNVILLKNTQVQNVEQIVCRIYNIVLNSKILLNYNELAKFLFCKYSSIFQNLKNFYKNDFYLMKSYSKEINLQ